MKSYKYSQAVRGVALSLLAAAALPAQATPFDTLGPFVSYALTSTPNASVTSNNNQWVTATGATALQGLAGTATIAGQGDIGVGRFSIQASGAGYDAGGWAGWHDRFTVNSLDTAQLGQTAVVSFSMRYDWSALLQGNPAPGSDAPSFGQAFVDINFFRTGSQSAYAYVLEDITQSCSHAGSCGVTSVFGQRVPQQPSFADGVATFYVNAVLGATYDIVLGMNALVSGYGGSVLIDATHTMAWNGINSVTTAGQAIAFTATSASGLNLLSPVPEASTPALWALGLGLLAFSGRRRLALSR